MSQLNQGQVRISWRGAQILIVVLAFLFGGLLYLLATQLPSRSEPNLSADRTTLDLGDVTYDTPIEAAFPARNLGQAASYVLAAGQ